jgi:hypothetical protein
MRSKSPHRKSRSPKSKSPKREKRLSAYQEFVKNYAREHKGKHSGPHAGRELISAAAKAWKLEGGGRISDFTKSLGLSGDYAAGAKKFIKGAHAAAGVAGHVAFHSAVAAGNVVNSAGYIAGSLAHDLLR